MRGRVKNVRCLKVNGHMLLPSLLSLTSMKQ